MHGAMSKSHGGLHTVQCTLGDARFTGLFYAIMHGGNPGASDESI